MTWVDAVVLLILACSALLAFMRGFVREALGLCAWVGAFYVAIMTPLGGIAEPALGRLINNPEIVYWSSRAVIFLAGLIVYSIIAGLIARVVRRSTLGGLDRTMGLLFGILRGAVVVSATYMAAEWLFPVVGQWPDAVLQARSLPLAYQGARWIADQLPAAHLPKVDPPPAGVPARSGALLQSAPHGYALGGRQPGAHRSGDQESR